MYLRSRFTLHTILVCITLTTTQYTVCTYVCVCMCICIYVCVRIFVCVYGYMYACTYVRMYVRMYQYDIPWGRSITIAFTLELSSLFLMTDKRYQTRRYPVDNYQISMKCYGEIFSYIFHGIKTHSFTTDLLLNMIEGCYILQVLTFGCGGEGRLGHGWKISPDIHKPTVIQSLKVKIEQVNRWWLHCIGSCIVKIIHCFMDVWCC